MAPPKTDKIYHQHSPSIIYLCSPRSCILNTLIKPILFYTRILLVAIQLISLCALQRARENARSVLSRLSYNTFRAESTVSVAPGSDITLGRERLELLVSGTIKKESLVLTSTFPAPRAARNREKSSESAYLIFLSAPANHYMYIRGAGAHTSGDAPKREREASYLNPIPRDNNERR
jgi:hypothetical protein